MAAAQAAAEAAIRDAVDRERQSNNQQQPEADIANYLHLQNQQDTVQAAATQNSFHETMGFGGLQELGDDNVESILEIMAQQQRETQSYEADFEPEPQLPEGPSVHYMTIAEDGKYTQSSVFILTIVCISNGLRQAQYWKPQRQ